MVNHRGREIKRTQAALSAKERAVLERPTWSDDEKHRPIWSEVLPGLWQGGTDDWDVLGVRLLPKYEGKANITIEDFDTVVTMYAAAKPVDWHVRELRYGMWDSNLADVDMEDLFDLVHMAHSDWVRGKKVLIRCQAGLNRSGLIMALVLIREGYTADTAIWLIREKRSGWALCNPDFERFLRGLNPDDWQGSYYKENLYEGLAE